MLRNLHVKNLALIKEIDVDFKEGLSVLTGETGAGKSIIIGSLQLALGQKLPKEMLKDNDEASLVEIVFETDAEKVNPLFDEWGIDAEDGTIVISRKIDNGRSSFRINGQTVTASQIRLCTEGLIEIHGQHENQKLLNNESQLELIDEFGGEKLAEAKNDVKEAFKKYRLLQKKAKEETLDEDERKRRVDFLEFQINEIEEASLKEGEDEELELLYKKLSNARRITETLTLVHDSCGYDSSEGAGEAIGNALQELESIVKYDEQLSSLCEDLGTIDGLLNDFNRDLASYLSDLDEDPSLFSKTEERLNTINHLKAKYGSSVEKIAASLEEKKEELKELEAYAENRQRLSEELKKAEASLFSATSFLTTVRKETAGLFEKEAQEQFRDLNFARADFEVEFTDKTDYTENGRDSIEFMIATNPGEPLRPLRKVASGGELSRIMLGIRTMFASRDNIETLIFDEIDTGISGRTAQKVAEKLNVVSRNRQAICITHLPQIAAMADQHYVISKEISSESTRTSINALNDEDAILELARLTGGAEIKESTLEAAREMKALCADIKSGGA